MKIADIAEAVEAAKRFINITDVSLMRKPSLTLNIYSDEYDSIHLDLTDMKTANDLYTEIKSAVDLQRGWN